MNAQNTLVLGTPAKDFDPSALQLMLNRVRTADDLKDVKKYILSYFARTDKPVATWMWRPSDHTFELFEDIQVKSRHIYKDKVMITLGEGQRMEVDIQQWFFKQYRVLYKVASSPVKPRSFTENGIRYLNQFSDFMHSKSRLFNSFNERVRYIVQRKLLRHIYKVWCSSKKELTEYVIDWLAHMINGEKVPTALYLKSVQGTGKSVICEFILNKVLGPQMVYKTSDPDQVAGKFNSAIAGKLLLYLEEMPRKNNLEWTAIADRFKALIDPGRIDINEKGKPSYNTDNTASIIVNTNRNAVRIDTNDRRWVFLDISDERVGDHEYFDDLNECLREPEVGEAFFAYMCGRARVKPDWVDKQAKKIPKTDTKQEQIIRNLDSLYVFIKDHFISHQQGLEIPQSEFHRRYSTVYENRAHDKYTVGSMMSSLGFKRDSKYLQRKRIDGTRHWCYVMSYDELYTLFDKKGWIHSRDREDYGIDNEVDELQKIDEISVPKPEVKPELVPKKTLPPVPSKPEHLKVGNKSSNIKSESQQPAPSTESTNEPEPYGISGPSGTSGEPISKDELEKIQVEEEAVASETVPETNIENKEDRITLIYKKKEAKKVLSKEERKELKAYENGRLNAIVKEATAKQSEPEVKVYTNKPIEDLYEIAKRMWTSDGGDPEEFDWESFAIEIEDLSKYKTNDPKDYYHYSLKRAVQTYRNKVNSKDRFSYDKPTYVEIAESIRKYYNEDRGRIQVTPPEDYKTVPIKKIQGCPKIDKKEYTQAVGYEECSDDDEANDNAKDDANEECSDDEDDAEDDANEDWYEAVKNA